VVRVVYQEPYDDPLARELFATVGVALEIHP
jgi:hypothetical protein